MGKTVSKEEKDIIIAQAGNSGGQTNGDLDNGTANKLIVITFVMVLLIVLCAAAALLTRMCRKHIEKKIRVQIRRELGNARPAASTTPV